MEHRATEINMMTASVRVCLCGLGHDDAEIYTATQRIPAD